MNHLHTTIFSYATKVPDYSSVSAGGQSGVNWGRRYAKKGADDREWGCGTLVRTLQKAKPRTLGLTQRGWGHTLLMQRALFISFDHSVNRRGMMIIVGPEEPDGD